MSRRGHIISSRTACEILIFHRISPFGRASRSQAGTRFEFGEPGSQSIIALAPSAGVQKALAPQNDGIRSSEQVIKVGYAYGTTLSPLSAYNSGSHEVFLSYAFKFETTPVQNKYANPRFL